MNKKRYHSPAMEIIVESGPVVLFNTSTPGGNLGDYEEGTQAARYFDFDSTDDYGAEE